MPPVKVGKGVQAILDSLVENYGAIQIDAESAGFIFGGSEAVLVKDLSKSQLLQYALLHAHVQINGLIARINALSDQVVKAAGQGSRAQRRHPPKGLILP